MSWWPAVGHLISSAVHLSGLFYVIKGLKLTLFFRLSCKGLTLDNHNEFKVTAAFYRLKRVEGKNVSGYIDHLFNVICLKCISYIFINLRYFLTQAVHQEETGLAKKKKTFRSTHTAPDLAFWRVASYIERWVLYFLLKNFVCGLGIDFVQVKRFEVKWTTWWAVTTWQMCWNNSTTAISISKSNSVLCWHHAHCHWTIYTAHTLWIGMKEYLFSATLHLLRCSGWHWTTTKL